MRINFDEAGQNYLEISKDAMGQIEIQLGSRDKDSPLKTVINSVKISEQQFSDITKEINIKEEKYEDG